MSRYGFNACTYFFVKEKNRGFAEFVLKWR